MVIPSARVRKCQSPPSGAACWLIFTALLGNVVTNRAQPHDFRFEQVCVEQGLSQCTVSAIFQDPQGYLAIYVNRSDLLKQGMKIRLNQLLGTTRVGKFHGMAEVILIREKRVMIQFSKAASFQRGELLALKIPSLVAEE